MKYLLYNPLAGKSKKTKKENDFFLSFEEENRYSMIDIDKIKGLINLIKEEDEIYILGGDGTFNYFLNEFYPIKFNNPIYFVKGGTGNDLLNDLKTDFMEVSKYLKNLPYVVTKNLKRYYLNNVAFGLDGEVCFKGHEKIDMKKNVNYSLIAFKLLFTYKKCDAFIIADGKEYTFKNVLLASSMNGRYYGGGMMMAPNQDRLNDKVSLVVIHDIGFFKTILLFPKIFKGGHIKYKKYVETITASDISVRFSEKRNVQIDGELVKDVIEYQVKK